MASTFTGPVQTGRRTGVPVTTTIGILTAVQTVSLSAGLNGGTNIVLPPFSDIVDLIAHVFTSASGNFAGVLVNVGVTGDFTHFAAIKTSAAGIYRMGALPNITSVSAAALSSASDANPQRIFIGVSAVAASALDGYTGRLDIVYAQRS